MTNGFREAMLQGTDEALRKERRIRHSLATAAIATIESDKHNPKVNVILYNAISHLAQIPELDIRLARYDYLMSLSQSDVDEEVYDFAKEKLTELEVLATN